MKQNLKKQLNKASSSIGKLILHWKNTTKCHQKKKKRKTRKLEIIGSIILVIIAFVVLYFSYVITRRKTIQLDETRQNDEVSILEEEREQGVVEQEEVSEEARQSIEQNKQTTKQRIYEETEVTQYIKEVFGEEAGFALRLAFCESSFNPLSVSSTGRYIGLFQFDKSTFSSNCTGDITNYRDQTRCAKMLIDRGELERRWPTCSQKLNQ